jgi:hypothetical protein
MSFFIGKGSVEVVSIKQETKSVHLNLYWCCTPEELAEPEVQLMIRKQSRMAVKYLQNEHFIPTETNNNWKVHIGVISNQ